MTLPTLTFSIIKLLFFGVLIWGVFSLVKKGIDLLLPEKSYRKTLDELILLIKAVCWTIFVFWSVEVIFAGQPLYSRFFSGLLILIIVGISWSLIRDVISGFFIRMEGTYPINGSIRVKDVEGKVRKLGFRSMEIETERGETVRIPYKIIDNEMTVKSYPIETINSHTFTMSVSKSLEFNEYKENIRSSLFNSHWTSLKKEPVIKLLDDANGSYNIQVTAYTVDDKYFEETERFIKTKFEKPDDNLEEKIEQSSTSPS